MRLRVQKEGRGILRFIVVLVLVPTFLCLCLSLSFLLFSFLQKAWGRILVKNAYKRGPLKTEPPFSFRVMLLLSSALMTLNPWNQYQLALDIDNFI